MNWWIWRVVVHPEIPDGLAQVRRDWSFRDLVDAWHVIDALEAARPKPPPRSPLG